MVRQLWLLRHADAEPHGTRADAHRALTERGLRQARIAGLALRRLLPEPDGLLASPKVRAADTARLAAEACGGRLIEALQVHEPLSCGYDAEQALFDLAGLGGEGRLIIVGHEPDLSGVIGALTGSGVRLKKAGLAVVRLDGRCGELILLLRPRELAMIAGEAAGGL